MHAEPTKLKNRDAEVPASMYASRADGRSLTYDSPGIVRAESPSRFMADQPFTAIFSDVAPQLSCALERIRPHWRRLIGEWRERTRSILADEADLILAGTVPETLNSANQEVTIEGFQDLFQKIGEQLAARRVNPAGALLASYILFELAGPYLHDEAGRKSDPSSPITRLYGLTAVAIISGYSKVWTSEEQALEKKFERAGYRQRQASAYVTNVYEHERRKLSHDLHDDIGHQLLLLKLYLELMATDAKKGEIPKVSERLEEALGLVSSAIDSVRRLVLDLGPAIFDELGFLPAIRFYARQFSSRTAISVVVRAAELPEDLPASHQVALYRVLQSALSNVVEHARAGRVKVNIEALEGKRLIMVVEDNGIGFDPAAVFGRSFGLTAMRERVEVLGGKLQVESTTAGPHAQKTGTRLSVELPLPEGSTDE